MHNFFCPAPLRAAALLFGTSGARSALVIWSIGIALSASAQDSSFNVGFLPGDAFYACLLDKDRAIAATDDSGDISFDYIQPYMSGSLGLKAGFYRLAVQNVSPVTRKCIAASYREMRKSNGRLLLEIVGDDGKRDLLERNPLDLLIYPVDCNFESQRFWLKYNEDWPRREYKVEGLSRGSESREVSRAPYVPFVASNDAIIEDWRGAETFPSLDVSIPDGSRDPFTFGRPNLSALSIDMQDVVLVVLAENDVQAYFAREPFLRWVEVRSDCNVLVKEFDENRKAAVDDEATERVLAEVM